MDVELNKIRKLFSDEKDKLPLVLQDIDFKEKQNNISSKIIQIKKYRTTVYPISNYYKNVTRIVE